MPTVNEHFKKHHPHCRVVPAIVCADGFRISVQASSGHYCSPKEDNAAHYHQVECAFPSEEVPALLLYSQDPSQPLETLYGWVPVELVDQLIADHGGLK